MCSNKSSKAFTLVELLAAMVVISIMAGMVFAALSAATGSAKRAAAETQVSAIQQLIIAKTEEYLTRRTPAASSLVLTTPQPGFNLRGPEANRSRLIVLRHYLRTELPDRKSDLEFDAPNFQQQWDNHNAATNQTFSSVLLADVPAAYSDNRYLAILKKLMGVQTNQDVFAGWSTRYEASECLYLILATSQVGGRSGLEIIPSNQISDLDGDRVPEILDPWGNPVIWIRWPAGYWLTYANRVEWPLLDEASRHQIMAEKKLAAGADQFDILQSDWRNEDNDQANDTFNLLPIVVSAGPDGEFDLMLRSSDASSADWYYGDPINFAGMVWKWNSSRQPVYAATYGMVPTVGSPYSSSNPPYTFIDPFATFNHSVDYAKVPNPFTTSYRAGLLGAYFDANDDGVDDSADNIFSVPAL